MDTLLADVVLIVVDLGTFLFCFVFLLWKVLFLSDAPWRPMSNCSSVKTPKTLCQSLLCCKNGAEWFYLFMFFFHFKVFYRKKRKRTLRKGSCLKVCVRSSPSVTWRWMNIFPRKMNSWVKERALHQGGGGGVWAKHRSGRKRPRVLCCVTRSS